MRQFSFFSLAVLLLSFASCKDDFELEAPFADIPVVNAYLDVNEDDNFIRVQKAFLGVDGNALASAEIADSIYYNQEDVIVSIGINEGDPVEMDLVDGADFGIERDTGVFTTAPNLLYLVPASLDLDSGDDVTITVDRPGETNAIAQTTMISPIDIRRPVDRQAVSMANYAQFFTVRWSVSEAARLFYVSMQIRIREFNVSDPSDNTIRNLNWVMAPSLRRESEQSVVQLQTNIESFWQFLGSALEENDDVIRQFLDFDVTVTAVGREVVEAIDVANANTGITSAQSIPVFTNVDNGLGLVTSRSVGRVSELQLDGLGIVDTLRNGIYTRDLGFQ